MAVAQFSPGADKESNLRRMADLAETAADRGATLVVFPEYSMYFHRQPDRDFVAAAEPLDGPFAERLSEVARRYSIAVVAGMAERSEDGGRAYNTVVALSPEGELLASYRKIHLFDAFGYRESDWVLPGDTDQRPTFEVRGLQAGLQTCYDLRFPEVTRRLVDAGTEVVLMPAQWVPGPLKEHHWRTLVMARAIEDAVYVVAADQSQPFGVGCSMIVDPTGWPVAQCGPDESVAVAELDASRIATTRASNPALGLRRFDVVPRSAQSARL